MVGTYCKAIRQDICTEINNYKESEVNYMEKPSKQFTLNERDWKAQAKSALIFLAPALLGFLGIITPQLQAIVPVDEKSALVLTIVIWGLMQATGLLRRYLSGK